MIVEVEMNDINTVTNRRVTGIKDRRKMFTYIDGDRRTGRKDRRRRYKKSS